MRAVAVVVEVVGGSRRRIRLLRSLGDLVMSPCEERTPAGLLATPTPARARWDETRKFTPPTPSRRSRSRDSRPPATGVEEVAEHVVITDPAASVCLHAYRGREPTRITPRPAS